MAFYPLDRREYVVIGIQHLSEAEAARTASEWPCLCFENPDIGFIAYVEDWQENFDDDPDAIGELFSMINCTDRKRSSWPGLVAAMTWAEKHGIAYLRFDRDTEVMDEEQAPELLRFEW